MPLKGAHQIELDLVISRFLPHKQLLQIFEKAKDYVYEAGFRMVIFRHKVRGVYTIDTCRLSRWMKGDLGLTRYSE
jgi:hypothetical protein